MGLQVLSALRGWGLGQRPMGVQAACSTSHVMLELFQKACTCWHYLIILAFAYISTMFEVMCCIMYNMCCSDLPQWTSSPSERPCSGTLTLDRTLSVTLVWASESPALVLLPTEVGRERGRALPPAEDSLKGHIQATARECTFVSIHEYKWESGQNSHSGHTLLRTTIPLWSQIHS